MTKSQLARKQVKIKSVRIPLKKLLHGKEIREAAKSLEDFRLKLNEQEILLGAKLHIQMDTYGEASLIASRPETDEEYAARLEEIKRREEAKKVAAAKREATERERAARAAAREQQEALDKIKLLVSTFNLKDELSKLI